MGVQDDAGLLCVEGRVGCGPVCTLTSTWLESSIAGLRRWRGPPAERVSMCSVPATEGWQSGADITVLGCSSAVAVRLMVRERDRDRDRETERDRERQRDRDRERQRETETQRQRETETARQTDGRTDGHGDTQIFGVTNSGFTNVSLLLFPLKKQPCNVS